MEVFALLHVWLNKWKCFSIAIINMGYVFLEPLLQTHILFTQSDFKAQGILQSEV